MRRPFGYATLLLALTLGTFATQPITVADTPATQPDPAADRLTFLTLQLSSIEASLNAVNLALRGAGYKVILASEKIDQYAKGNEYMDRNGGAPIAWDKFYGKTAKEFEPRDVFGVPHPYDRPSQFDYLYHANNDQIAKANNDVAALGKKIDVLLARRRQLESEQSALWATIAWESIENHDIPLNPLYRFQLKADNATPASDARRDVLRPAILFLRTINKTVNDDLESLSVNQEQTLGDLKDRTQAAYAAVEDPFANAMLSADMGADDLKSSKELLAAMKHLAELAKNITEAYHLALDGDVANDDGRKLTFRAQLQFALLDYSTAAATLDYQLVTLAKSWGLEGERGVANPDPIPGSLTKITAAQDQRDATSPNSFNPASPPNAGGHVDLLKLVDPRRDAVTGTWNMADGVLSCDRATRGVATIEFPYTPPAEYDFRVVFSRDHENGVTGFILSHGNQQFLWLVGGTNNQVCGFSLVNGKKATDGTNPTFTKAAKWIDAGRKYVSTIRVRNNFVEAYLDDKLICHFDTNYSDLGLLKLYKLHRNDTLGIDSEASALTVESAEVIEVTGSDNSSNLRTDATPVSSAPQLTPSVAPISQGADDRTGWVNLFSGNDLAGWEKTGDPHVGWKFENGILLGKSPWRAGNLSTQKRDYKNFRLRFQTMLSEGAAAGVLFRSNPTDKNDDALQIDIAGTTDRKPVITGSISTYTIYNGGILQNAKPVGIAPNQWFDMEIVVEDDKISAAVNGQPVLNYIENKNLVRPDSIAIICRGNSTIRFRNLQVMELR